LADAALYFLRYRMSIFSSTSEEICDHR
jgi:hypothetical protein